MLKRVALFLLLTLPNLCWGAVQLTPYKANYQAYYLGKRLGTGERTLEKLGEDHYRLHNKSKLRMLFISDKRSERAEFRLNGEQLDPLNYHSHRSGSGKNHTLDVDYQKEQIEIRYDKKSSTLAREEAILDRAAAIGEAIGVAAVRDPSPNTNRSFPALGKLICSTPSRALEMRVKNLLSRSLTTTVKKHPGRCPVTTRIGMASLTLRRFVAVVGVMTR